MLDLNRQQNRFDESGTLRKSNLHLGYVDVINEGELVKLTLDQPKAPAVILIRDGKFYSLKQTFIDRIFDQNAESIYVDYVQKGFRETPYDLLRPCVSKNMLFYEYI